MLGRLSIVSKLLLLVISAVLLTSLSLGYVVGKQAETALRHSEERGLLGTATSRRDSLQDYLFSIEQDLVVLSSNELTIRALRDFEAGWDDLGTTAKTHLQRAYITENPHPTGEKSTSDR